MASYYDIIKINSSLFALLASAKVSVADVQYLDMYEKYKTMRQEGKKVTYIKSVLADEYHLTYRYIEKILQRMERQITI